MWIWIANKFAKFYAKRLNRSQNIPKVLGAGATIFETRCIDRHCVQVKREKADVQQTIDNLIKAIEDKENFIKVAQSRLLERTQRLGCENCHDKPMIGLVRCIMLFIIRIGRAVGLYEDMILNY